MGSASLVDLAGSEKASEAAPPDAQAALEAVEINKSLLGNDKFIRAMGRRGRGRGQRRQLWWRGAAAGARRGRAPVRRGRESTEAYAE